MSATAELEAPQIAEPKEPKVIQPHAWAGRSVFYWREESPGVISSLVATLLAPTRGCEGGWDLNFWRRGSMQGREKVKFSDKPKACCWTWPPAPPKTAKA